ncbi:MAG: flagellar biosynthesis protein FlhA [Deltaproteobacteria bacterium]|nr:flagellar biosynthesis protein FlhA [Deltaproteobacteria bacterium]
MNEDNSSTATENLLGFAILGILGVLIVPLPGVILDSLLALSIAMAVLILLVSLRVRKPLDLSVFPAFLLIVTLFRLGLNVASTRLILLKGGQGEGAAGHIIQAFGQFAVGGSIIVGAVVFLILLVVNFMVITKGSGRIAEVSARFTLDALPGKQMSIDADLAAGALTDQQAKARRAILSQEAEFFGAMDGASKFVRGDAVAGLIITAINIVGGLLTGLIRDGMNFADAVGTYVVLTIGDGLLSQMPALFISTAAGIVITKAGTKEDLGKQLSSQILGNPQVLISVALVLVAIGFLPGMPLAAFMTLAVVMVVLARRASVIAEKARNKPKEEEKKADEDTGERMEDLLAMDTIEVELGMGLINLIDGNQAELPGRVTALRKQIASELGIVLPPVHLKDSLGIDADEYRVSLRGLEIAAGKAFGDRFMVLDPAGNDPSVMGISATEPTFGLPARWVSGEQRGEAEAKGYTVIDSASVLTTHLGELLRKNAYDLVGRQETQELLDVIKLTAPRLVDEVVPQVISLGELAQVVRGLLREGVSVRDFKSILEAVADASVRSKEEHHLVEAARLRLRRQITSQVAEEREVKAITLDRITENALRQTLGQSDGEIIIAPDVETARKLITSLEEQAAQLASAGYPTVVLAPPDLRRPIFNFASRFIPDLWVISARELTPGTQVEPVGVLQARRAA